MNTQTVHVQLKRGCRRPLRPRAESGREIARNRKRSFTATAPIARRILKAISGPSASPSADHPDEWDKATGVTTKTVAMTRDRRWIVCRSLADPTRRHVAAGTHRGTKLARYTHGVDAFGPGRAELAARFVPRTVDTAMHNATQSPVGRVRRGGRLRTSARRHARRPVGPLGLAHASPAWSSSRAAARPSDDEQSGHRRHRRRLPAPAALSAGSTCTTAALHRHPSARPRRRRRHSRQAPWPRPRLDHCWDHGPMAPGERQCAFMCSTAMPAIGISRCKVRRHQSPGWSSRFCNWGPMPKSFSVMFSAIQTGVSGTDVVPGTRRRRRGACPLSDHGIIWPTLRSCLLVHRLPSRPSLDEKSHRDDDLASGLTGAYCSGSLRRSRSAGSCGRSPV